MLLDDYGLSYDQIEKALDAIIHNHGQENIAAAKRVEFVLDDMLTNGYQSMDGYIPPNQDYINAKASIAGYVETAEGGSGYLDRIDEAPVTAERMEQNGQQGQSRETAYLMETSDGFLVRVPESKLEAWKQAQKEAEAPLTPPEQRVKDKILSMIYGENR